MAAIINLAALTFTADQLRQMNELVVKAVLEAPELARIHPFETGVKNDKEIGIVPGSLGLLGKAAQGCNPTADIAALNATKKTWALKRVEIILDQCYTDIETSMIKLARKLGVEVADLTNTEYFAFLLDMLQKDIPKMIFRHIWFGDTAAANVSDSPAGVITDGIDVDYFNVLDGLWKQLAVIYAADADRKVAISANAQATRALQFSAFTAADAATALNSVVDGASPILGAMTNRIILVTRSVFQKAYRYLQATGQAYKIELLTNGFELGSWDGIPMLSIPLWDQYILAYFNNGTKLDNPHRILYTTTDNLPVGMEGTTLFDTLDSHYDKRSRYNRIETSDAFDTKVLNDEIVQVGI